ncbi:MAG TPA: MFS transporter [Solirubrobacteraceae bacterium]|jgi:DHA3 family tetracycline resistance protein-like MFS transporter
MSPRGVLASRDFRLLFAGRSVSLLGDGAFLVALAWQAYTISNAPSALSLLGIAMTVPLIALLLFGGVVSDRHNRRRVMLIADLLRAVVLALLGALAMSGALRLWQMMVLVALYGGAQAFFDPASDAILPELLPANQLGEANALEQVVRPLALRLAGPALGGILVGTLGAGSAFFVDAATFLASASALWAMSSGGTAARGRIRTRRARLDEVHDKPAAEMGAGSLSDGEESAGLATSLELREGWSYVRRHVWLWGTLASAGIAYLLFMGPAEVLLPYMVKHVLGGSGVQLGLVLGAGGLGSVGCALAMLHSGLPSRSMTFIYVVWALATLSVAGYGLASTIWQLMLASLAFNLLETAGTIVWATFKQRHVPGEMLGRVSSLDWLISIGLLPLSFALTAPLSAALGARATLIGAGLAGAAATLGGLALPGMRAVDGTLGGEDRVGSLTPSGRAATIN